MKKTLLFLMAALSISIVQAQIPIAGPQNSCVGGEEEYTAGYSCGNKYKWSCGGCTFMSPKNGNQTVYVLWTTSGTKTITVSYSGSSCPGSGKPANLDNQSLSVNVIGDLAAPSSISGPSCISNQAQTISFTSDVIANASSYYWTISGTGWSLNSSTNQTISANAPAGFAQATLCVQGMSTCGTLGNTTCITITRIGVTDIFYNQACQNRLTRFSIPGGDVTAGATYTWSIPSGDEWNIAASGIDFGQGYPQIDINVGNVAGNVCVTKSLSGCASASYCEWISPAAIGTGGCARIATIDNQDENNLTSSEDEVLKMITYPNPSSNIVVIKLPQGYYDTRLVDSYGKEIQNIGLIDRKYELDVSTLNNGVYILKAKGFNKTFVDKILVIK